MSSHPSATSENMSRACHDSDTAAYNFQNVLNSSPKKIGIYIDGTWMTPANGTNVYKMYKLSENSDNQMSFYFEGLGTKWYTKLTGGIFGCGIKGQIMAAYSSVVQCYNPGDSIYLVGFSRGAYAVRALSGLLYFGGVLHRQFQKQAELAWRYYRARGQFSNYKRDLWASSCIIESLICFDTVAAIGWPFSKTYSVGWFPHLRPMPNVKRVRHALAIDERRVAFTPVLFDESSPEPHAFELLWQ